MPQWDPTTYLEYADERGRPFVDLIARVPTEPRTIVDLGCGAGNLGEVLRSRWPQADIVGVDSSVEMIDRARQNDATSGTEYVLDDIATWRPETPVDLIVSNAAFQWMPDQLEIIPRLREYVAPGGVLAFQVPDNYDEPSHVLLRGLAADPRFVDHVGDIEGSRGVAPRTYLELLADDDWHLDVWGTTYLHVLPGDDPVFAWIRGTGARPYVQALPDRLRAEFEADYRAALRAAYPKRTYGTVLPFPRTFVVAKRRT